MDEGGGGGGGHLQSLHIYMGENFCSFKIFCMHRDLHHIIQPIIGFIGIIIRQNGIMPCGEMLDTMHAKNVLIRALSHNPKF